MKHHISTQYTIQYCVAFHTELIFSALIAVHWVAGHLFLCMALHFAEKNLFDFHSENLVDFVFA